MKIALCFFGVHPDITNLKNGTTKNLVPYFLKKNVFDINPTIDTFVHSWSIDKKNKIINEYKPLKYIIEKQKIFDISDNIINLKRKNSVVALRTYGLNYTQVSYSVSYSIKKVLSIMKDYEIKNNFEYDIVILSMMDVVWLVPLKLDDIDKTAIYNPIWGVNNYHGKNSNYKQVKGDWFISNSKNIKQFSKLYDNLYMYLDKYKDKSSFHTFFKDVQDLITDNIKYKYNDQHHNNIELCRNRYLPPQYFSLNV